MKSTMLIVILLLSPFLSYLPSSTAKYEPVALLDNEGREVKNGGMYYLVPATKENGGGVQLAKIGNQTCPRDVVLSPNQLSNGEAIGIESNVYSRIIYQDHDVWIGFASVPKCTGQSFQWTVENGVVVLNNYSYSQLKVFQFHKVSSESPIYKLIFCRSQDPYDKMAPECYDIGIHRDQEGYMQLVTTNDNPLLVMLQRVKKSTAGKHYSWP